LCPGRVVFAGTATESFYTRPLTREAGELRCEARVIHIGGRTATSEARIVDAKGKLYAHGTTTCIVVEKSATTEDTDPKGGTR
jgi:uncharacterized protein (TIGR00369 family)